MPSNYPTSLDSFSSKADGVDIYHASDVNNLQDSVTAIENIVGAAPATISDTSTAPADPATVAAYLDMVAYQLKALIAGVSWKNAPGANIAQLLNRPYVTVGADAVLTGETPIATILSSGTFAAIPAAAAGNTGWYYYATDRNTIYQSNGSAWGAIGFIPNGTPAAGSLIYYDAANNRYALLPIGTANQVLTVISSAVAWATPTGGLTTLNDGMLTTWNAGLMRVDLKFRKPFIVATDGTVTEFTTITSAIATAVSGQAVVIPPGTYNESITLKSGVMVCEAVPGTVTIQPTAAIPVTAADGGSLIVDTIAISMSSAGLALPAINSAVTTNCFIRARSVSATNTSAAGGSYAIGAIQTGAGTLTLYIDTIISATTNASAAGAGVAATAGVLNAYIRSCSATGAASYGAAASGGTLNLIGGRYAGALYDLYQNSGTLNVYGVQYDPAKTSGTITFLPGDRDTIIPNINNFRLTLTSGTAVTTADVTGATSVYMTALDGNQICLYSGSTWKKYSSSQLTLAIGTLTSGLPYDVFCYDNAGTLTLELLAWTNGTTRATTLTQQDGVWCKTGALTRRYLGTFYTTATTTTEDSVLHRYLFNASNRKKRDMIYQDTTASWTYASQTWQQLRGQPGAKVDCIVGLVENMVGATFLCPVKNPGFVGIGLNSTTVPNAIGEGNGGNETPTNVRMVAMPAVGLNSIYPLQRAYTTFTTTYYGTIDSQAVNLFTAEVIA